MTRSERTRRNLHWLALALFALLVAGVIFGGGVAIGALIEGMS